ncbi:MAG: peroxidase family protein, partial [Planctomycetota bacterium]
MDLRPARALLGCALVCAPAFTQSARSNRPQRPDRPFPPLQEPRTFDGSGNSSSHPARGAAHTPMVRLFAPAYADGTSAPSGPVRPSARFVSNGALRQDLDRPAASGVTDMFWQWGQFLDHDLVETPLADPRVELPIEVPAGDPWFDPDTTGTATIPLGRSDAVLVDGVRNQINAITAWIDGSQIYGSDADRARALRALDGTGRLRTSEGNLLPYNTSGVHNLPDDSDAHFVGGDIRVNEQVGLTTLHTIFVREHNVWAARIAAEDAASAARSGRPPLTGDEIYELARGIVSAELQLITYREWLPLLLGDRAPAARSDYDPDLDGGIRNAFATAAFRLGHSMLSPELLVLDGAGRPVAPGNLRLARAFFAAHHVETHGIDPFVRGLLAQEAQELDAFVVDDVRNFLFGAPGAGGFDLAALNLQRARDHGLPSYGAARAALGLSV